MSMYKSCLGLALLLCLSPACIFSTSENDPDDWDIKENNSNNQNNKNNSNNQNNKNNTNNQNNTPGYEPVTLRLLTGKNPAFYEPFSGPAVISVTDERGEAVSLGEPGCNCTQNCPVGAAPAPMPQYIAPNDKVERSWDGSYWVPKTNEQNCAEKKFKPKGAKFFANFCTAPYYYTSERGTVFGEGDQSLINCEKVPFFLGEDTLVQSTADWKRQDLDLKVVFENPPESPVKLFVKSPCYQGSNAWFTISQSLWSFQAQTVVPGYQCNAQACGVEQEQICALADFAPCQEFILVEPGKKLEHTWDGWGSVLYEQDSCALYQPAARGPAKIEVCYRPSLLVRDEPAGDMTERCETLELKVSDEPQRLIFKPSRL